MARLGNTGVSSLLSSANSTQKQLASLEDVKQSQAWQYGPQDQAAYDAYTSYINSRIGKLQTTGTIADQEKAQTFLGTSMSVARTYRSQQIQNATQGVLEGNASDNDKLQALHDLAVEAYKTGDIQSGQNIAMMYDRQVLSMQAKSEALQRAAEAGEAKAQAALAKGYKEKITEIQQPLKEALAALDQGKIKGDDRRQLVQSVMAAYNQLGSYYNKASNDGGLSDAQKSTFQNDFDHLQSTSTGYEALSNPAVQQAINDGKNILNFNHDPLTKTTKIELNRDAVKGYDAKGEPIIDLSLDTKGIQKSLKTSGKADINIGGINGSTGGNANGNGKVTVYAEMVKDPVTGLMHQDLSGKSGYYYVDPTTGHKIDFNPATGEAVLAQKDPAALNSFVKGGQFDTSLEKQTTNAIDSSTVGQLFGGSAEFGNGLKDSLKAIGHTAKDTFKQVPGVSLLDSLMHPDHTHDGTHDSLFAGVSHFFSNPTGFVMDNATGIQKAKAFEAQSQLARQQLAAAQQAHTDYAATLAASKPSTAAPAPTGYNPATNTVTGTAGAPNPNYVNPTTHQSVVGAYTKAATTIGSPEFNSSVGFNYHL